MGGSRKHVRPSDPESQLKAANAEGRDADRIEPRATAVWYVAARGLVLVELRSGVVFGFPGARIPGLEGAGEDALGRVRISPSGDGLHWDEQNVQVSLTGLIRDTLNLAEWAPRLMAHARNETEAHETRRGLEGGRRRQANESGDRSGECA